jgi:esterase/lipase superfamily enzyme
MKRFAIMAVLMLLLQSCAERGVLTIGTDPDRIGSHETILVATSRGADPVTGRYVGLRAPQEAYALFDVSVPPNRNVGEINWPPEGAAPDPSRDFITTRAARLPDPATFRRELGTALRNKPEADGGVVIFVHGFNTNFAEGLYRIAQIDHDLAVKGVIVHYSWPSSASALGYLYDRDSVDFARDGLEDLIQQVKAAGASRITLVAHSMGSYLVMETMRQMAIRNGGVPEVSSVFLLSPDIDVDLFISQAETVGDLPQPFIIFTSANDRALGASSFVSREGVRLGNLQDPTRLADLDVTLIEVGAYSEGMGHDTAVTSPEIVDLLNQLTQVGGFLELDQGRVGLLEGAMLSVQQATRIVVPPTEVIASQ